MRTDFYRPTSDDNRRSRQKSEKGLVTSIASTGQGSGAAQARRITGRHAHGLKLAKDIPELRPYVGDGEPHRGATLHQLEIAYFQRKLILLEGTQGSGLSIFHGVYPYVTSRDTNVGGCLAEAGISPNRIRRTLMVVRPTPIRVGNPDGVEDSTSGPLKHEVSFEEVAKAAGLDAVEVKGYERTSTTKRARRVSWFEWDQFRMSGDDRVVGHMPLAHHGDFDEGSPNGFFMRLCI